MSIVMYTANTKRLATLNVLSLLKNRDKSLHHVVVTPDRCAFNIEKMLFDIVGEESFFDVDVMTITRLCRNRLKDISFKKILSKQSGVAIIKRLLLENRDQLHSFKNVVEYTGFASELFETIALYKSCNISYDEVYVGDNISALNYKQQDIKLIYRLYEEYLKDTYTDSFNQLNLYAENINKDTYPNTIFYFIEADDYTAQVYNIISKFARFSTLYIGVPFGEKSAPNKNIYSNKIYYNIIELSNMNNIPYSIKRGEEYKDDFKKYLSENIYSLTPPRDIKSNDSRYIKLLNYESIEDEVKNTIQAIKYESKTEKISLDRFAIIVPSIDGYKDILTKYFREYGISYYLDSGNTIDEHYISRLIFKYFNIMKNDYSEEDLFDILSSPFFNLDRSHVFDYINHVDKFGLSYANLFTIDKNIVANDIYDMLTKIHNNMSNYHNILTIQEWLETINYSINFVILDNINSYKNSKFVKGNIDLFRTIDQLLLKIEKINLEIGDVFSDYSCNFDMFYELYKSYFESTSISLPPITSNTLFVGDAFVSFLGDVDYVYILGANDGSLPMYQMDMGILTDRDISQLPNASKIEPTIRYINKRNKYNVFELMLIANKRTTISYITKTKDGSKLYKSSVITSLASIINEDKYFSDISGSAVLDYVAHSHLDTTRRMVVYNNYNVNTLKYNFVNLLKSWDMYYTDPVYRDILNEMYTVLSTKINVDEFLSNLDFKNILQNLKNADKLFFRKGYTSISEIENYYHCPYKHFVTYGLRLKEKEWSEVRPMDNGNILHDFLYVIVKKLIDDPNLTDEDIYNLSNSVISKVLDYDKYKFISSNPLNAISIRSLKEEAYRVSLAIYEQNKYSSFKPEYFELDFSGDNAIDINVGGKKVKLIGKIDRVDICDDGFRVIDYKTGDNSFTNYSDICSGKKLQLIMYLKAYGDTSGLKPMGAFYFPISNNFIDGDKASRKYMLRGIIQNNEQNIFNMDSNLMEFGYSSDIISLATVSETNKNKDTNRFVNRGAYTNLCISSEDIDRVVDFALHMCERAIRDILAGDISIRPLKSNKLDCEYCEYIGICNRSRLYGNHPKETETVSTVEELEKRR